MIILGDELIEYEELFRIYHKEQITETPANKTVLFKYNSEILKYAHDNNIQSAVIVTNIQESIYANALEAKYIICQQTIAKKIQTVADTYMFDSKVLVVINSNEEFEKIALDEIDGVIYEHIMG